MTDKKALMQEKAQANIEELEARLATARAKLKGAGADARLDLQEEIERIEAGLGAAKERAKALVDSADEALDELADKLASVAEDLGGRIDRLLSKKR